MDFTGAWLGVHRGMDAFLQSCSALWADMLGREEADAASSERTQAETEAAERWSSDRRTQLLRTQLLREFGELEIFEEGVLVVPRPTGAASLRPIWEGLVLVSAEDDSGSSSAYSSSAYSGGVYKFRIEIPREYPQEAPCVFFQSEIFHPLVCPQTGQLDISLAFHSWKAGRDSLALVVAFVRNMFRSEIYSRNLLQRGWKYSTAAVNEEAQLLMRTDFAEFERRAKETAHGSLSDLWHCSEHDDVLAVEPLDDIRLTRLQLALHRAADKHDFIHALKDVLAG